MRQYNIATGILDFRYRINNNTDMIGEINICEKVVW